MLQMRYFSFRLKQSIEFTDRISPICLPDPDDDSIYDRSFKGDCFATGIYLSDFRLYLKKYINAIEKQ